MARGDVDTYFSAIKLIWPVIKEMQHSAKNRFIQDSAWSNCVDPLFTFVHQIWTASYNWELWTVPLFVFCSLIHGLSNTAVTSVAI